MKRFFKQNINDDMDIEFNEKSARHINKRRLSLFCVATLFGVNPKKEEMA